MSTTFGQIQQIQNGHCDNIGRKLFVPESNYTPSQHVYSINKKYSHICDTNDHRLELPIFILCETVETILPCSSRYSVMFCMFNNIYAILDYRTKCYLHSKTAPDPKDANIHDTYRCALPAPIYQNRYSVYDSQLRLKNKQRELNSDVRLFYCITWCYCAHVHGQSSSPGGIMRLKLHIDINDYNIDDIKSVVTDASLLNDTILGGTISLEHHSRLSTNDYYMFAYDDLMTYFRIAGIGHGALYQWYKAIFKEILLNDRHMFIHH